MPEQIIFIHYGHDKLWKNVIEDFAFDFVHYFYPELVPLIDFSVKPKFLEHELTHLFIHFGKNRRVDKLVEFALKDGRKKYLIIHIEVQEYTDPEFDHRMFQNYYRILEHFGQDQSVDALAILADASPSFRPGVYKRKGLGGTELTYAYKTFKLLDKSPDELQQDNNPFGLIMLLLVKYCHNSLLN